MVTSQTGTWARPKCLILSLPLSSALMMDQGGLNALSWRIITENHQLTVNLELVQDLLLQLDPYKSIRPDGIPRRILKELADVIAKHLLMIFEQFQES